MIFFETERLVLRQVTMDDAPVMFDYRNNEVCSRYQRGQCKQIEEIRTLIAARQHDNLSDEENCFISVALKDTGAMVGEIIVMPNDGCISLGYTFSYNHHRRGYSYEALSLLIDTLHERYPQMEFICFTDPENAASIALLKKLGYTNYGYVEKITSNVFGKWVIGNPLE